MFTPAQLARATGDDQALIAQYLPLVDSALRHFGIYRRLVCIGTYATIRAETDWRWLTEIGGGSQYEGRADLGNTQPGDGARFPGTGFIQITGRTNFTEAGAALGIDLVNHPEYGAEPANAALIAAWFLFTHGVYHAFDAQDWYHGRTMVNGGTNGYPAYIGAVQYLLTLPAAEADGPSHAILGVDDHLWPRPEVTGKAVADLHAGCIVTFDDPQGVPYGVTPHFARVKVLGGTTQKLKPAAGLMGWLLRANLRAA